MKSGIFNYDLIIIKAETKTNGTVFHKFSSMSELKWYLKNTHLVSYKVVKSWKDMDPVVWTDYWFNKSAKEIVELSGN